MKPKIVLRADGNSSIGFGHIFRLLALADILKEEYYLVFALYDTNDFIKQEIVSYCNEMIILSGELPFKTPDEISATEEIEFDINDLLKGDEIVVLDGYYFGVNYQKAVKRKNCKLVCIDDLAINYFVADAVINHAPGVEKKKYKTESYTKIYTGLEYAIVRKPFFKSLANKNITNKAFISLGGSDYFGYSKKLADLILPHTQFESLNILCSSSFSEKLLDSISELQRNTGKIELHFNVDADKLVAILDNCTHAFVAASTVLIEAYARGLKCFAGFYTKNQQNIYNGFVHKKIAFGLGDFNTLNDTTVKNAIEYQDQVILLTHELVSGKNIRNIFHSLSEVITNEKVYKLRKAVATDSQLLFNWANDVEVRRNAINTEKIDFEEHTIWFKRKISSSLCSIFILESCVGPVGQIRFDYNDEERAWEIDYSVAKEFRGKGIAKVLLAQASYSFNKFPLVGYVKDGNEKSINVFTSFGFINAGIHQNKDLRLIKYIKNSFLDDIN